MEVTVKLEFDAIRIYIGDLLHLHIKRSTLLSVQSWRWPNNYFIEYVQVGGATLTEYTSEEMWKSILQQLDKLLI